MATGCERRSSKGDDFRHTCGLCMEPYVGRQPKILPCFHTFCLPCLTTLAAAPTTPPATAKHIDKETEKQESGEGAVKESNDNGDEGSRAEGGGRDNGVVASVFQCPTCRSTVTVPEGGVASLQTNFYLDHEAADGSVQSLACQMCEEEQAQDATHACDKCQMRMCHTCHRLHDKVTDPRVHRVRPLANEDRSPPPSKEAANKCPIHPDQQLVYHCQKCDISICVLCKLTSHDGHMTEDMVSASRRAMEDLTGLLTKASEQIQVAGTVLDRLDHEERELARQKQEVTQEVDVRYDTIVQWASRARDEIRCGMMSKERKALRDLQAERTNTSATVDKLSELISRSARLHSSSPEAVKLKAELQSALLNEDSLGQLHERAAMKDELEFFPLQADTSVLEVETVRVYMGALAEYGRIGSSLQDSSDTPSKGLLVRVDDLTNKLEDIRSQVTEHTNALRNIADKAETQLVTFLAHKPLRLNGSMVVFEGVCYDHGECYNRTTGVFTAPLAGTYMFFLVIHVVDESTVRTYIKYNDFLYGCAIASSMIVGSTQVVLKLKAGDKVFVSTDWRPYTEENFFSDGCYFTGSLIHAQP